MKKLLFITTALTLISTSAFAIGGSGCTGGGLPAGVSIEIDQAYVFNKGDTCYTYVCDDNGLHGTKSSPACSITGVVQNNTNSKYKPNSNISSSVPPRIPASFNAIQKIQSR